MMEKDIRRLCREVSAGFRLRFSSDWIHVEPGFEKAGQAFFEIPQFFDQGEVVWKTRTKKVRKLVLPPEYDGTKLVFKEYRDNRVLRYLFCRTKSTLEAINYKVFSELGIPMAPLVFVGDARKNFILDHSFIATRFIEGYTDGRTFLPGGKLRDTPEQKKFIDRNLEYTGKIHGQHCFHGGMRVYNFLWKPLGNGEIDIVWIDVATSRFLRLPEFLFTWYILRDLTNFFRDLKLSEKDLRIALATYKHANPRCSLSAEELFERLSFTVPVHSSS